MIRVEIRSNYAADQPPQTLGQITVHADGNYTLDGLDTPAGFPALIDFDQPMLDPGHGPQHFRDDPIRWARLLPRNFHGLSWRAHIVEDTEAAT